MSRKGNDRLMAKVNPVKVTDSDRGAALACRQVHMIPDDPHAWRFSEAAQPAQGPTRRPGSPLHQMIIPKMYRSGGDVPECLVLIVRAIVFLAAVAALTWASFHLLIEQEVKRVASLLVMDKATHLVEIMETTPGSVDAVLTRDLGHPGMAETLGIARGLGVAPIYLFGADGEKIGRVGDQGAPSNRRSHTDTRSEERSKVLAGLSNTLMPDPSVLRPLFEGRAESFVSFDAIDHATEGAVQYAVAVLPLSSPSGDRIGFVGMVLDTSHIHAVYAGGTTTLGLLFLSCGVILFGVPAFGFWLQRQLTERSTKDAKYHARHDPLTGLLNRTSFVAEAEKWLRSGRIGYAAYVDVDRFKLINDTHGHAVGDAFLRHVAGLLRRAPNPLVARLGGDEFTVVLPKMPREQAAVIFKGLVKQAAEDVEIDGITVSTSFSIGVAVPQAGDTLDALLQRADVAIYAAKSQGRKTAAFYTDEMGEEARRRRLLEMRLRDACREGDFALNYQPLVDAKTGQTLGYEALLRLNDLDGLPISPEEFVGLAEEIGLIEEIGTWVLRAATKEIAALNDTSYVAVNLSAEQFQSGRLVKTVEQALKSSGLPAERLELEITESVLLEEGTDTKFQIDSLKEAGIRLALDDFGTGYSSLSSLWKYGFDRIKIDKSFVRALDHSHDRMRELIDVVVILGRRLGMMITAEGVETEAQRRILVQLGCQTLQGYYFGTPVPIQQVGGLVEAS